MPETIRERKKTAELDETEKWPVAFALTGLTAASEERITELVKKATG